MGAVLFGEKLNDTITPSSHGSTYGGNPICAAGAISIVERIDDKFLEDVTAKGKYIIDYLSQIDGLDNISGM